MIYYAFLEMKRKSSSSLEGAIFKFIEQATKDAIASEMSKAIAGRAITSSATSTSSSSTTSIYVLLLEGEKYYVGKSDNVQHRYKQHVGGNGSAWTRKYKPVSIDRVIDNASPFDEDKITKEYMAKYGIDNVRGGSYVEVELDENIKMNLQKEIRTANDRCMRCGRSGHFVKSCYAKTDVSGKEIGQESDDSTRLMKEKVKKEEEPTIKSMKMEILAAKDLCTRCGRSGHGRESCYAKTEKVDKGVTEKDRCDESSKKNTKRESLGLKECSRCGRSGHAKESCYAKTEKVDGVTEKDRCDESSKKNMKRESLGLKECSRCGRSGHAKESCYAKTDVIGRRIDDGDEEEVYLLPNTLGRLQPKYSKSNHFGI